MSCWRSCNEAKTRDKKAKLVQRLAEAEAREAEDGEPGASNAGSAVAEACKAPEPVQERQKCQRRVAISESEDSESGLVDDASIEDDSSSPPGEPLVWGEAPPRQPCSSASLSCKKWFFS